MQQAKRRILKTIEGVPLATPVAIASFAVPAMLLLLLDAFKSIYVWPLGLAASYVAVRLLMSKYSASAERPGSKKEQRICDILVVLGVILWVVFNSFFTFQHVYTNRDPATYANAGIWLIDHESLRIERPDLFDGIEKVKTRSAGFHEIVEETPQEDVMHAQGAHLLPTFLGLGGRLVGVAGMFHLAPIFGGTALLALYALGRQLVKSRWAVIATVAFASSLPLIYFSRDTYTEPLAATFIFGGLALLYASMKAKKPSPWWFMAGLTLGASVMMRIDSFLAIIAIIPVIAIWLGLSSKKNRRKDTKAAGYFAAGLAITSLLGWLDLRLLSTDYLSDLAKNFNPMMYVLVTTLVLGVALICITWKTSSLKYLDKKTKKWRSKFAAFTVLAVGALLFSQPLWRTSYSNSVNQFIYNLKESTGISPASTNINGAEVTRIFSEYGSHWAAWYIGPVIALLAFTGLAFTTSRILKKKDALSTLPVVAVVGVSVLLYFIKPSITPDHIWASRRFVPVILPGMALFAAISLEQIWKLSPKRLLGMEGRILATVLATLAIVAPLIISMPFIMLRERTNLTSITDMCSSLPDNSAVLWVGTGKITALQPTYSLCEVPVGGVGARYDLHSKNGRETLIEVALRARTADKIPVIAVFGRDTNLIPPSNVKNLTEVHNSIWQEVEYTLLRPPHRTNNNPLSIKLGLIQEDGSIAPIAAANTENK